MPQLCFHQFLVSAKGFFKTQPVAELVSEIFRLRPGELENPRPRNFNWDKFVQVIKGIYNLIKDQAKIKSEVLIVIAIVNHSL